MEALALYAQLAEIIVAATITSLILRKLKQPNLLAYIVAGILIGPLVAGSFDFNAFHLPFSFGIHEITPEIKLLSELGAAFLLFSIGIETSVKRLLSMGKPLVLGTFLQVIGVITLAVLLTYTTGLVPLETAMFIGTIIAFSSTMIVIKLLADRKETNTLNGRIIISILLIQDFLVIVFVPLLQNISQMSNPAFFIPIILQVLSLLVIALLANRFLFPALFNMASKDNEAFFLASVSTAFIFIGISFWLSIPITIGAFIGGLALNSLPYNTAVFSKVRALRDFFLTIFFVSLGAELTFAFGNLSPALMAAIIILIFVLKPLVFFIVGLLSGYGSRLGIEVGLSLAQVSEFGFVIAALGATAVTASGQAIIPTELLSFIIAISAVSMMITPNIMGITPRASNWFSKKANAIFKFDKIPILNKRLNDLRGMKLEEEHKGHIVIIGGGLIGRRLARKLRINHKVMIIDSDPEVVAQGKKEGLNFIYSTANDSELLEKLELDKASAVLITMAAHAEGVNFIREIKSIAPQTKILATTAHFYDAVDYYEKGADYAAMPALTGLPEFYDLLQRFIKTKKLFVSDKARKAHLKYISEQAAEETKYRKKLMA